MNKVKQSLLDNQAEILAALPENEHAAFKSSLDSMTDDDEVTHLSGDAEVAAIKAELVANPDVDESAAAAELSNITPTPPFVAPTEEELEFQKAEALKEAQAMVAE